MKGPFPSRRHPETPGLHGLVMLAVFCLASCGGSKPAPRPDASETVPLRYTPSGRMTARTIHASGDAFTVRLPEGWMEAVDEKNAPDVSLWIVTQDYSSSISFTPILMDPSLYASLRRDGLRAVAKVSLSLRKDRVSDSLSVPAPIETYRMAGREFCSFEYSTDGGNTRIRVVIFDTGGQFVECSALPPAGAEDLMRDVFEVQQGVLSSLAFP